LGENSDIPFKTWDTIIQATDNFSWTHGKHGFKFGADVSRTRYNVLNGTVTRDQYNEPASYVPQWSFGVQRQLTRNMSLETNYVGSSGVHLKRFMTYNTAPPGPGAINPRRPFPIFNGAFQVACAPSHSSYDALQVRLVSGLLAKRWEGSHA
jgi:hypothetical protein